MRLPFVLMRERKKKYERKLRIFKLNLRSEDFKAKRNASD